MLQNISLNLTNHEVKSKPIDNISVNQAEIASVVYTFHINLAAVRMEQTRHLKSNNILAGY